MDNDNKDIHRHEQDALRGELQSLKNCQITFLSTSITATGILLGFGTTFVQQFPNLKIVSLFPLVVLFPAWWIFFDKATTITRIVGYYRFLERLIIGHEPILSDLYIGWENALREFRCYSRNKLNKAQNNKDWFRKLMKIVLLKTTHKYWVITFYTFMSLSGLCIVISLVYGGFFESLGRAGFLPTLRSERYFLIYFVIFLFLLSFISNFLTMWRLIYGINSYDINEQNWLQILEDSKSEVKEVKEVHLPKKAVKNPMNKAKRE